MIKKSKKAFSLIEVIISISILSFVMVSLIKIKSENLFLIEKSSQIANNSDFILLGVNFNKANERNKTIYLKNIGNKFQNDEMREELKDKTIKLKDKKTHTQTFEINSKNFTIQTYTTTYNLKDSSSKKKFYSFKIKL